MENLGSVEVHAIDDICSQLMKNYSSLVRARLNASDENAKLRRSQLEEIAESLHSEASKIKLIATINKSQHKES